MAEPVESFESSHEESEIMIESSGGFAGEVELFLTGEVDAPAVSSRWTGVSGTSCDKTTLLTSAVW